MLRLDTEFATPFLKEPLDSLRPRVLEANKTVLDRNGAGGDMLGWRDMLQDPDESLLDDIRQTADRIRSDADVLVCIGIGGSYLGAKAMIEALTPYFQKGERSSPEVLFAGNQLSGAYLQQLLEYLDGKSVYVNVISKSGTTLEPAVAFRFLREWLRERFQDADRRIIVTTDPESGALNQMQRDLGYKKYVIPRDVGGRFSVLTPVGLLPIAVAGIDIHALFHGAVDGFRRFSGSAEDNPALDYAGMRYQLLQQGYGVEVFATFEPRLGGIGEWWQQLFGESEGKEHKGLFPARVQYTTDLHSLGQYVQQGQRILIETFLMAEDDEGGLKVPGFEANLDKLNYISGKTMTEVNRKAYEGTARAHKAGGVPNTTVWIDRIAPETLGECLYFFEHAVAVSGYLLGVNPFDQPGVEAYKKEMFSLLGKG
ncbi:MAG TPA: glucose-6-phosphate isomerase [Rhodothermales bacterium]|nr:glucose-6-phosphate isomerase [Rhodothermales bacterium]